MKLRKTITALALVMGIAITGASTARAGNPDGNFMIRFLGAGVLPDSKVSTSIGLEGEVTDAWVPATTLTYFLNRNLALELLCCVAQHKVDLDAVGDVGKTWIFPPTVTVQYHFTSHGAIKPYIGAGVTWIHFFNEKGVGRLSGVGLRIDDAFGFALQAGVDVSLGRGWFFNADVKKIFLDTDATYANGVTAGIDLDPWVVSFGLGYRFNLEDVFGHRRGHEPLK